MFNLYLTLLYFILKTIATRKWHMDESTVGQYDIIFGKDLLTNLVINCKFSDKTI